MKRDYPEIVAKQIIIETRLKQIGNQIGRNRFNFNSIYEYMKELERGRDDIKAKRVAKETTEAR